MPRLFRDLFTQWLEGQGFTLRVYQPGGFLGSPPLGWQLTFGNVALVYRVPRESPETLLIVLIERQDDRKGLKSSFTALVRFLSLVRRSGAGIVKIQGHVEAVSWRPEDSLQSERIRAFYERYLGVRHLHMENGLEWVGGEIETYVPPLAAHRNEVSVAPPKNEPPPDA